MKLHGAGSILYAHLHSFDEFRKKHFDPPINKLLKDYQDGDDTVLYQLAQALLGAKESYDDLLEILRYIASKLETNSMNGTVKYVENHWRGSHIRNEFIGQSYRRENNLFLSPDENEEKLATLKKYGWKMYRNTSNYKKPCRDGENCSKVNCTFYHKGRKNGYKDKKRPASELKDDAPKEPPRKKARTE